MPARDLMPVRFQRSLNREVEGVKYYHLRVVGLTEDMVKRLGWKHLDELHAEIKGDTLSLRLAKK